ncbi:hypothetical protein [Herbidospora sp. RD11066]
MTISDESERSMWTSAKLLIRPNPLLALVLASLVLLFLAVFVFGGSGKYPSADAAEILRTLSVGVLAAVVATIIDRAITFRNLDERLRQSVREATSTASSLSLLGIRNAHPSFDFKMIFKEARRGETISWLDTYCPRQNEFIDDLMGALRRGVSVRMLVIDPTCENARFRDQELEGTIDTGEAWTAGLEAFIRKMEAISTRDLGRFEIRYYRDLPCIPMYLIGKPLAPRRGYFSIFLTRATAHCQHLELRGGEWLHDMANYFEKKWTRQEKQIPEMPQRS